jgi:hypothetical protein
MADFVAVIRRAVDGLATNSPEARAKVYEKARGAVQRQLENMKPRPPEEMLRRQMDKLETAIVEVESEHAEALAPFENEAGYADDEFAAGQPVPAEETVLPAPPEPEQEPAPAPGEEPEPAAPLAAPEPAGYSYDEPPRYEERHEPVAPAAFEEREPHVAHHEPALEPDTYEARTSDEERHLHDEPAPSEEQNVVHSGGWPAGDVAAVAEREEHVDHEPATHDGRAHSVDAPIEQYIEPVDEPLANERDDDLPYAAAHPDDDVAPVQWPPQTSSEPARAEHAPLFEAPTWHEPTHPETTAAAAWDDVPELVPAGPVEPAGQNQPQTDLHSGDRVDAHFDQETHVTADAVRMPSAAELPSFGQTEAETGRKDDREDFFAGYQLDAKADEQAAKPADKDHEKDPWSDLDDLIGYSKGAAVAGAGTGAATANARQSQSDDSFEDLMPTPAKPYRVTTTRKRNYGGLVLGLVGLLLLGGAGYAAWMNRDSLSEMVSGLMPSSSTDSAVSTADTPATSQPASGTASAPSTAPATTPANPTPSAQANGQPAGQTSPPPAADGSTTTPKFTQRLMPDGTEVDEGPGSAGSLAQNAEGQSVAQLNAPPTTPSVAPGATATPAPGAPAAPAADANPAATPAIAGEKMFLYEERLGQTAPTAIDGSVSWSLQREPGSNGGPPQAEVQARITIPGRGLTALVTFKRNSDPSLPASHLIEIVFAVPPDFEGGAIDSVQRIAMKTSEQDRGNALIAVPAKITDDFHMIALNDFPDARNTNLELLRTRNWIDIPVAYRNGRRALFTLQKGPEGEKAFNEAIREWGQSGGGQTGQ